MSPSKTNRILGLTVPQVALIAIMACILCARLGIFGGLIVSSSTTNLAPPNLSSTNTFTLPAPPTITATLPSPTTSTLQRTDALTLPLPDGQNVEQQVREAVAKLPMPAALR